MKTKQLLRALKLASSALHTRDFIPILTHFCFSDDQLYAFDDRSAIIVFEQTGLHCAVPGKTLLELLTDAGEEVEVSKTKTHLVIKDGNHEMTIPVMPENAFVFEVPQSDSLLQFDLLPRFTEALEFVAVCSNVETIRTELLGVMFMVTGGGVVLYSTDNISCTRVSVQIEVDNRREVQFLIPRGSAELVGKIYRDLGEELEAATLGVTEDLGYLVAQYMVKGDAAPVVLVCRTLQVEKFAEYEKFFKGFEKEQGQLYETPEGLGLALKRCVTVSAGDQNPVVELDAAEKGRLWVSCTGGRGKVEAMLEGKGITGVKVKCDPSRAARALEVCDRISVHGKGLSFRGDLEGARVDYIVAPIYIVE